MTIDINGQMYYTVSEVCQEVAISRPTLSRWIKRGILTKLHRDRKGWRIFTEDDLERLRSEAGRIVIQEVR